MGAAWGTPVPSFDPDEMYQKNLQRMVEIAHRNMAERAAAAED